MAIRLSEGDDVAIGWPWRCRESVKGWFNKIGLTSMAEGSSVGRGCGGKDVRAWTMSYHLPSTLHETLFNPHGTSLDGGMHSLKAFRERCPDATGNDLALTVAIANRLTSADLRYRSLIADGLGLAIWIVKVAFCLGLPLVAVGLASGVLERWIDSELALIWLILVAYSCLAWMLTRFTIRQPWVKRTTDKVQRRTHIYGSAIVFKRMVLSPRTERLSNAKRRNGSVGT